MQKLGWKNHDLFLNSVSIGTQKLIDKIIKNTSAGNRIRAYPPASPITMKKVANARLRSHEQRLILFISLSQFLMHLKTVLKNPKKSPRIIKKNTKISSLINHRSQDFSVCGTRYLYTIDLIVRFALK